jgi:branched-chain amino acid transport system substrate-binding protein
VGDKLHPLFKVTDFSPYISKIKASGADSVITGHPPRGILACLRRFVA